MTTLPQMTLRLNARVKLTGNGGDLSSDTVVFYSENSTKQLGFPVHWSRIWT
ncbi:hypothetical protein GCM10008983_23730 [Lentibacillus halophilus]|uniref:Uncharacterized protein n=1 Tax=Lentibacillus halophilus TaxID=295065 RepID=A0ABN0ZF56_9BACI